MEAEPARSRRGAVEGSRSADAEFRTGGGDQRLGLRLDQAWWRRRRDAGDVFRQALALIGVKYREAFEEGDRLRVLTGIRCAPSLLVGHEAIGVDDGRAAFALSDVTAEPEGLAEGRQL